MQKKQKSTVFNAFFWCQVGVSNPKKSLPLLFHKDSPKVSNLIARSIFKPLNPFRFKGFLLGFGFWFWS